MLRDIEEGKDGVSFVLVFKLSHFGRKAVDGHNCDYRKQWGEDVIDGAVEEVIRKLVQRPKFADAIKEKSPAQRQTLKCPLSSRQ